MIRVFTLATVLLLTACHPAPSTSVVTPDEDAQLNNAAATLDGNTTGDAP